MIQYLSEIDTRLFLFLNNQHNHFWDFIMWYASEKSTWLLLYLVIILYIINKYKKDSWRIFVAIAIIIFLSDKISSGIIKVLVERLRPSQDPSIAPLVHILNNYKGGLYGFVSSHAANSFAIASFTSLLFKNKYYTFSILLWASFVSYSRIYLGVHYPGDILGGIIVGLLSAFFIYHLYKYIEKKYFKTVS